MQTAARGGWLPTASKPSLWSRLWEPFWAIPLAIAASSVGLGLLMPGLDKSAWRWIPIFFHGGPDGARSLLGTIASAMISVTGLVFSITMVVLQLASSQFTPRVLGSFLESRITQFTLGVFSGTFLYALTVLRSVQGASDGVQEQVPQLATSTAFVGVVASVGFFLAFIHHITTSIQVPEVLARTASATVKTLDQMMPADHDELASRGEQPRWEPSPDEVAVEVTASDQADRCITDIDYRGLVDMAQRHDAVITLERQVGEYVVEGMTLARIWQPVGRSVDDGFAAEIVDLISLSRDRSLRQDAAFGIRQIVDIAEKALSPGVNDPTTAAQAVDALHSVLRRAVQREVPSGHATDDDGTVRLVYRPQSVEQLLDLAIAEIAHWGRDSIQIPRRLCSVLDDLDAVALPVYRPTIARLRNSIRSGDVSH